MKPKYYITSAIPYVNDLPHLGTSYEQIATDVIARYRRFAGNDVFFLTGTDENSLEVERKTRELGVDTQQYCDEMVEKFKEVWQALNISNDGFIRTTEPRHIKTCQKLFQIVYDKGNLYKDFYRGWYCSSCELFLTEDELTEDKKCPVHEKPAEWIEEENYFFRLTKYEDRLLKHINENPEFIQPETRRNEILGFFDRGLKDFSASRASTKWGTPTPIDPDQRIYVWFDALVNYLSGIGYFDDKEKFERYWPADLHVIGKDISRFHCIYWPAILMSIGLPLPKTIFVHGFVLFKGEKMSKTRGIYVDPKKAVDEYGADSIRYHLMRDVSFGRDGDFSWEAFVNRYNADLANDYGNLLNRTLNLVVQNFDGMIPEMGKLEPIDQELVELAKETAIKVNELMNNYQMNLTLETIWQLIRHTNKYIDETAPWQLASDDSSESKERMGTILYNCLEAVRFAALLTSPFMPSATDKIFKQMGVENIVRSLDSLKEWGRLPSGVEIGEIEPVFPRIEVDKKGKKQPEKKKEEKKEISIDDFKKIELRLAEVISAEQIENTDNLLKLKVNIGHEKRQIIAGIAQHYSPEELVGKKIVLVTNLEPAKIRGVKSQGMLLAAVTKDKCAVVTVDSDMPAGTRIR